MNTPTMHRGFRTGEAFFTTLRWHHGPPASWPWHWRRLQRAALAFRFPPLDVATLRARIAAQVPPAPTPPDGWRLRLTVVATDPDPLGYLAHAPPACHTEIAFAGPAPPWSDAPAPLTLALAGVARHPALPSSGHKRLAIADDLHWRHLARAHGADDAILLASSAGEPLISETTTAALLLQAPDGQWLSPCDQAAPVWSTTLSILQTQLSERFRLTRRPIPVAELLRTPWRSAFTLSALSGARPISRITLLPQATQAPTEATPLTLSLPASPPALNRHLRPWLVPPRPPS